MTHYEEEAMKRQIATSFIGCWLANNYNDACLDGEQSRLNSPPIADAEFLAKKAIEHWKEHGHW